jgi:hypothetical protein
VKINKIIADAAKITNKLVNDFWNMRSILITSQIANILKEVTVNTSNDNNIAKNFLNECAVIFFVFEFECKINHNPIHCQFIIAI